MIRVDAIWLSVQPLDMRAGTDKALARVVAVFGAAHPHHAYVFANRRGDRLKVLVPDGIAKTALTANASLTRTQFDALVLGLPWERIGERGVITVL